MDYYFGNPNNPNPYYHHSAVVNMANSPSSEFMLSDYLMLEDVVDHQESWSQSTETESSEKATSSDATHGVGDATSNNIKCENNGIKRKKEEVGQRVTFRTRSQLEIMDDGYKWRKYGKKSVKNSPNPRNYYKCSGEGEGCKVKKRVERDRDDSSYVLTTYEGVHNHESPSTAYYSQISLVHSNDWPLHPSANSSSII